MDDALQFKKSDASLQHSIAETKEREAEAATAEEKRPSEAGFVVTRTKDLRGVLCPMNFVRTKLELSQLQSGDVLEILLDDGKPIENVPGSVRLEGHTVLSEKQLPDGYWQVIIKKK
ncbi:MAG: sulfurtransferase TusA family protein [Paludibacteraceae bacterium]|nr:sulfurtransferase TusA family protein [Paludibacteraceae bacterium]